MSVITTSSGSAEAAAELQPETFLRDGRECLRQKKYGRASSFFRQALDARPDWAEAHNELGLALAGQGQHAAALASFEEALRLQPAFTAAHLNRANTLRRVKRLQDAVNAYEQAICFDSTSADAFNNLGIALLSLTRPADAADRFRQALRLNPEHSEANNNLGVALADQGLPVEAAAIYRQVLQRRPRSVETHNNLGVALAAQGKSMEAIECYRRALELKPNYAEAHNNLGNALRMEGRLADAIGPLREAIRLKPDYAEAHNNLAIALSQQGGGEAALASYSEAIRLKPDYAEAHTNRALALLTRGDYEQGWPEYEWRRKMKEFGRRKFDRPDWDGSHVGDGAVLLWTEQGMGDTLQFVRYAALAKTRAGAILLEAPVRIHPLLKRCPGIDRLLAPGKPRPDFVAHAPLLSLPGILGTDSPESIPAPVPYLSADPNLIERWRSDLGEHAGFKIGIAWQGSPTFKGDRFRSIPLRHFAPLANLPGVRLYSLQKGFGIEQVTGAGFHVTNLGPRLDESDGAFMDTAAVMQHLDLVVTSDTSIAHLAGALGVRVWVTLARPCDWRWLLQREDTPWYPTMRLFRQRQRMNWDEVFERITAEVSHLVSPTTVRQPLLVEISLGELLDKITILEIKRQRINDQGKLLNVCTELGALLAVRTRMLSDTPQMRLLARELRDVNERLWVVEDEIRQCEQTGDFGSRFIGLARSVYQSNDRRSRIKRQINGLCRSTIIEEKQHPRYDVNIDASIR